MALHVNTNVAYMSLYMDMHDMNIDVIRLTYDHGCGMTYTIYKHIFVMGSVHDVKTDVVECTHNVKTNMT